MAESIYDFEIVRLNGSKDSMANYRGKVLLIVNTASECGFTPQYQGLEALYKKYETRGFEVLAFPCNQFGGQEPGSAEEIAQFCDLKYKTTFKLFAKIDVNGENAHPLFTYLKKSAKGIFGTEAIKWNFTKFLVNQDGSEIERFAPNVDPEKIAPGIEKFLT